MTRRRYRLTRPVLIAAAFLVALPGAVALAGTFTPARATSTADRAATPHLDAVEKVLRQVSPGTEGAVWQRTVGNKLATPGDDRTASWLLQTPGCWGDAACADRSATRRLLDGMTATIAAATRTVDISTLAPLPDGPFQDAIVAGLKAAARTNKIKVRVLVGAAPLYNANVRPEPYRDDLVAKLGLAAANVSVNVASMTTSKASFSWNHTKILVVDGATAIVGGINDWKADYVDTTRPVTDLDLAVSGPAATSAGSYLDTLWSWTCERQRDTALVWLATSPGTSCLSTMERDANPKAAPVAGAVPVIAVGGLGVGIRNVDPTSTYTPTPATAPDTACAGLPTHDYTNADRDYETVNPEENALRALVSSATSHVEISQQDVNGTCPPLPRYDVRLYDALAAKLAAGVKVRIVVSDPLNRGLVGSGGYSQIKSLNEISDTLRARLALQIGDPQRARAAMCGNLQLATFRSAPAATMADGRPYALHHKLVAVDSAAFYLGSKNLYPVWLQDFGYIVENGAAAAQLTTGVLDPEWTYSQATATFDYTRGICAA